MVFCLSTILIKVKLLTAIERADCKSGGGCGKETFGEEAESLQQRRGVGEGSGRGKPPEEE